MWTFVTDVSEILTAATIPEQSVHKYFPVAIWYILYSVNSVSYKYYVSGHYPSSCFYLKHRPVYISKHNVSETALCFRHQVKPTQLAPIDRASPYLRTPVPAPRWGIQTKHSTNHLRELRQNIKILKTLHVWGTGRWIMSRNIIFVLMYHRHKLHVFHHIWRLSQL
jgi:hypothetical protein